MTRQATYFFSDTVNYWNKGFEKLPWKSFKRQKPFWLFATSKTKRQISRKRIRAAFGKVSFCFMTWNDVVDLFCMLMIFLLHCFSSSQIREDAFGKQIKLSTFCFIQFSLVSIPSCFERSEKPAIEKINQNWIFTWIFDLRLWTSKNMYGSFFCVLF